MKTPEPPTTTCIIEGCNNEAQNRSNHYRTEPLTCPNCYQKDLASYDKPRRCNYCNRRRQCQRDLAGKLVCRSCTHQQMDDERRATKMAHSHSIAYAKMSFQENGTPESIQATTHCQWSEKAELEMVKGLPTYIIQADRPLPLFYDHRSASCPQCRHNGERQKQA